MGGLLKTKFGAIIIIVGLLIISVSWFGWQYESQGNRQSTKSSELLRRGCQYVDIVEINGTSFCTMDVTNQLEFAIPGYSQLAAPVTFMGVTFQTYCPPNLGPCAGRPNRQISTAVGVGVLLFNLTFSDGHGESAFTYLPYYGPPLYILSKHSTPRAGFSVAYVKEASVADLRITLLVQI